MKFYTKNFVSLFRECYSENDYMDFWGNGFSVRGNRSKCQFGFCIYIYELVQ